MEQIIELKGIINFAKSYRIAEGGTTNEGITINYILTDSLRPFDDETNGSQGYKSSKSSIPLFLVDKLVAVPGQYKLLCQLGVNSAGQPQLKPVDVEFLNYCDVRFSSTLEGLDVANNQAKKTEPVKQEKEENKK